MSSSCSLELWCVLCVQYTVFVIEDREEGVL